MNSFKDVFLAVKLYCEDKLVGATYNLFIEPLEAVDLSSSVVTLQIGNEWAKGVIEERFIPLLVEGFENVLGFTVQVVIKVNSSEEVESPAQNVSDGKYDFTFENFIIGSTNKFAHAAAIAVAQMPAAAYNPLFIHGDSGLGKTHLLKAIQAELEKNNPNINILYVDGETFTNEIITAIRENKTNDFQAKYRQTDVLLVDDIQFIAGKESTQEEFFHTFNALHNAKKQIVLVSDRPPKEIKSLEDRIRNSFEWGLIADIQPPDFETRCALIKRKSDLLQLDIKNDVIEFIAGKVKTNIRQIEGVVKKLDALKKLESKPPIIQNAQLAIKDILNEQLPIPATIEKIIFEVSRSTNVPAAEIKTKSRKKNISEARKMAMYIVREVCQMTMAEIGKEFDGRDHATVVYSLNEVKNRMEKDVFYKDTIEDIIKNVKTL